MMMTRTRWLTVMGAGLAGLLAVVPAEARAGRARAPEVRGTEVRGTVDGVDPASNELTLAGKRSALTVTDETRIVKDGRRAALSDVREGDEVRASYDASGQTQQVTRLEVMGPTFTDQG
jgi:hypothetical protein